MPLDVRGPVYVVTMAEDSRSFTVTVMRGPNHVKLATVHCGRDGLSIGSARKLAQDVRRMAEQARL